MDLDHFGTFGADFSYYFSIFIMIADFVSLFRRQDVF